MLDSLIPGRFLFHFSAQCLKREPLWTAKATAIDEACALPSLAELDGRPVFAEVRAAWGAQGLGFAVHVQGKKQPAWCRDSRMEDSDGVQIWVDTRDVHNVHRATRFCHRFIFLPGGGGAHHEDPVAAMLPIHRAKELPRPIGPDVLKVRSQTLSDGYWLEALIPAEALSGFEPDDHPRIGFTYAVIDRELGQQTFGPGSPMNYQEDPSLWATLELKP